MMIGVTVQIKKKFHHNKNKNYNKNIVLKYI